MRITYVFFFAALMFSFGHGTVCTGQVGAARSDSSVLEGTDVHSIHYYNCAINVGMIVLRLNGCSANLTDIGSEMHAGEAFERTCSLADLKRTFETNGLAVKGFRFGTASDFTETMKVGSVAVIRLKLDGGLPDPGHFAVVLGAESGIVIEDWPDPPRWINKSEVDKDKWFAHSTGEFLLISPSMEDHSKPMFSMKADSIDLGRISRGSKEAIGQFEIRNDGGQQLRITTITGPCHCFQGATGDMDINGHSSSLITIRFDPTMMPVGHIERILSIETNDPNHSAVPLKVTMEIEGDLAPEAPPSPTLRPLEITWGRASASEIKSKPITFALQLPLEEDGKPSKVTFDSSLPTLSVKQVNDEEYREADNTLSRTVKYQAAWTATPDDGEFHGEIHFAIDRGSRGIVKFTVPFSGDAMKN